MLIILTIRRTFGKFSPGGGVKICMFLLKLLTKYYPVAKVSIKKNCFRYVDVLPRCLCGVKFLLIAKAC